MPPRQCTSCRRRGWQSSPWSPASCLGGSRSAPHRQDCHLRRVDYCRELGDAEHPQVGDGKGSSLKLVQLELVVFCPASQLLHVSRDLLNRLACCILHNGCD